MLLANKGGVRPQTEKFCRGEAYSSRTLRERAINFVVQARFFYPNASPCLMMGEGVSEALARNERQHLEIKIAGLPDR